MPRALQAVVDIDAVRGHAVARVALIEPQHGRHPAAHRSNMIVARSARLAAADPSRPGAAHVSAPRRIGSICAPGAYATRRADQTVQARLVAAWTSCPVFSGGGYPAMRRRGQYETGFCDPRALSVTRWPCGPTTVSNSSPVSIGVVTNGLVTTPAIGLPLVRAVGLRSPVGLLAFSAGGTLH